MKGIRHVNLEIKEKLSIGKHPHPRNCSAWLIQKKCTVTLLNLTYPNTTETQVMVKFLQLENMT